MQRVRKAEFEDMKTAADIMVRSFRAAFSAFVSEETMAACTNDENCRRMMEGIYTAGKMRILLGETGGMLVWQEADRDSAEIVAIHSVPESWGTGLGAAMLETALEEMRAAGKKRVWLWAFEENHRARRFYEKHGFRWDGARRVSEFDGAMEVRYGKEL